MRNFFELIEKIGKHFYGVMSEFRKKSVISTVHGLWSRVWIHFEFTLDSRVSDMTKTYSQMQSRDNVSQLSLFI